MTKAADWHEVDRDHHSAFQRVFNAHPGVSDVAADCPVCSHATLHRFYLVEMERPKVILGETYKGPGRLWQWCSTCKSFGYYPDGWVPEWWTSPYEVDKESLRYDPGPIEEARSNAAGK
ncbi:hypothetical protein ABIA35_001392 [Catenulispora sp. MAP12-49]|uniref:hypothetical protein n=1 Tax=Catenulispora sp. MAP12-49 TaxID=3156302 RepID=UPI0035172D93